MGAGRSASTLIRFLQDYALNRTLEIVVCDISESLAISKTNGHPKCTALGLNMTDRSAVEQEVKKATIVVSMLPPALHANLAEICLEERKHLLTASYLSETMKSMDQEAKMKGLIFLNECGLDPGIDHMSAMEIIHRETEEGNEVFSFKSFCGGLVAPECDNNPWGYKFTWNPRNVILAGQGGDATFIRNGQSVKIPYEKLFLETEEVAIPGLGNLEGYYNRDSVHYMPLYRLEQAHTFIRGTLRNKGFCAGWNALIAMKLTNTEPVLKNLKTHDWTYLLETLGTKNATADLSPDVLKKLNWLGIPGNNPLPLAEGAPADLLQAHLEKKWKLKADDKDMVVMLHEIKSRKKNQTKTILSSLVVKGEDAVHTAMSKTVGLPLGLAARLILENKILTRGVCIPTVKDIYEPVMKGLGEVGIRFTETVSTA